MEKVIKYVLLLLAGAMCATVVYVVSVHKFDSLKNFSFTTTEVTAKQRELQLECLAKNIYYEAGGEPFEGKVAVAQVTLNRAES